MGGWFNELLKRTQTLVNSLRAGEPSCLALGPEVNDPLLHPDREREPEENRERENHQKLQQITTRYVSLLVCGRGQSKASKISKSFSFSPHP